MKFKVTKRQVLNAIKTEPLRGGTYCHVDLLKYDEYKKEFTPNRKKYKNNVGCPVCAVGSVLDKALGKKTSAEELDDLGGSLVYSGVFDHSVINYPFAEDQAKLMIKSGLPLSGLSSFFEYIINRPGMKNKNGMASVKARKMLTKFVKENFPKTLTLNTTTKY